MVICVYMQYFSLKPQLFLFESFRRNTSIKFTTALWNSLNVKVCPCVWIKNSFRQGSKRYKQYVVFLSQMTRPFLKSWIDGEAVVWFDLLSLFLFFRLNIKLIFKTCSACTSHASPVMGVFQNSCQFFVLLLCMIFIINIQKHFLHNCTDAEHISEATV